MDLAGHFRIILQNWWRILLVSFVIALAVFVVSTQKANEYEAKELLQVTVGRVNLGQTPLTDTSFFAKTYSELATTPAVIENAVRRTKLRMSGTEAEGLVSAGQVNDLGFMEVRARGSSKRDAETLSRAVSQSLVETVALQQSNALLKDLVPLEQQVAELRTQLAAIPPGTAASDSLTTQINSLTTQMADRRTQPTNGVFVVSTAKAGSSPVSPQPLRDALLAFVAAFVVTAELSVVIHAVGDRFSKTDDSSEITGFSGLPVLAKIPQGSGPEVVEAFRVLRTNLMFLEGAGKPRTVAVVSANTNAGKTFCAINLAESAAALDEKVVLVDGDLRRPAIHERMRVDRAPGISAVLQGGDIASSLRKTTESPFLRVLPSGAPVHDPSGVLGARAFRHVLDALRAVRLVVVDTPPGALFADAMAIASQCDATIFVIDVKTSRRRAVRSTLESLERAGANLVGVVVNRSATPKRSGYYES